MKPLFQITAAATTALMLNSCMSTGSVSNSAMNDDLYYGGARKLNVASSANPESQVSATDIDNYNKRVDSYSAVRYASAAGDAYANDERDFSDIQNYYSAESEAATDGKNKKTRYLVQVNDTTFMEAKEADGVWIGGFNGSDSDQDYAERLIKFHGPMGGLTYFEPAFYRLQYDPDWNIYMDSYGYAHIVPSWSNPYYSDYYYGTAGWGWGWNWGWGHHGWHSHFGFGWNWGYGYYGYGYPYYAMGWYGYYDPWYYGGGWYGVHGYHHHHHHGYHAYHEQRHEHHSNTAVRTGSTNSRNNMNTRNVAAQERYSRGSVSQYTAAENRDRSLRSYTRANNTNSRTGNVTTVNAASGTRGQATSGTRNVVSSNGNRTVVSSSDNSNRTVRSSGNSASASRGNSTSVSRGSGSSTNRVAGGSASSSVSRQSGSGSRSSYSGGSSRSSSSYSGGSSRSSSSYSGGSSSRSSYSGGGGGSVRSSGGGGGRSGGGRR